MIQMLKSVMVITGAMFIGLVLSSYKADSLIAEQQKQIDSVEYIVCNSITESEIQSAKIEMIEKRLDEMREDYAHYLAITIGVMSLIGLGLGVAAPLFVNRNGNKSIKNEQEKILNNINEVQRQLKEIKAIEQTVFELKRKIETAERNAKESQKQSMINRLLVESTSYYNKNDHINAIKCLDNILKIDANNIDAFFYRATSLYELKNYYGALEDINNVLNANPLYPNAFGVRAFIWLRLEMYDNALQDCNKALSIMPNDAKTYTLRGEVHYHKKEFEKAINDFNAAAVLMPLNLDVLNNRACTYYELGEYELAIADATNCIKINPNYAQAYETLCSIYMKKGPSYFNDALNNINKFLELAPTYWDAYKMRSELYNLMMQNESDEEMRSSLNELRKEDLERYRTKNLRPTNNHNK